MRHLNLVPPMNLAPPIQPTPMRSIQTPRAITQPRVLLAEDDGEMCLLLGLYLTEAGYDVIPCHDGSQLVEHLGSYFLAGQAAGFDLIVSDIRMPFLSGLDVLEGLHDREGFPPMILITAFGDVRTHERARQLGAAAFFDKPFSIQDLVATVQELVPVAGDDVGFDSPDEDA